MHVIRAALFGLLVAGLVPGAARAADFGLAYDLRSGADEDDTLHVAHAGDLLVVAGDSPLAGRLYDGRTGAFIASLACDVAFEDDAYCDLAAAASRRHVVLGAFGHLHIFDRRGRFLRRLDAPAGFELRTGLAVDGRRILAGAVGNGGATAFVLDLDDGAVIAQLADPAPADGAHFGSAAVLRGNVAIVAAPGRFTAAPGRVTAFDARTGAVLWTREAPEPSPGDGFGAALASLRGDVIVGPGAVRLDGRTGRVRARYRRADGSAAGAFGGVAAWGRTVVVGDPQVGAGGEVLVFDADSGRLVQTILQPAPTADPIGLAVSLARAGLAVASGTFEDGGHVRVFRR